MNEFIQGLIEGASNRTTIELIAVSFSVLYVLLASFGKVWCWPAAFISTSLFTYIMFEAKLYLETILYIYYVAMAFYGWYEWVYGGQKQHGVAISSYTPRRIVSLVLLGTMITLLTGFLFERFTDNSMPYLDAFTTIFALITTWMVARKILENWLFWIVIDASSVFLFLNRELYFTTGLYIFYTFIAVFGYFQWRKLQQQTTQTSNA